MANKCYNCGVTITSENKTKEHIPAKALFVGYPLTHKINRVTVFGCKECNNFYSSIDEEFRNLLGVRHINLA